MKKQNYFFISIVFISSTLVLQSCKEDKNATEEYIESSKEVAVEIFQEKTNVQYVEPIYEGENPLCAGFPLLKGTSCARSISKSQGGLPRGMH